MKKILAGAASLFLSVALAQTTSVVVTVGTLPLNLTKKPKSIVTVGFGTPTLASGVATIPISTSTSRIPPAGLQFNITYATTDLSGVTVSAGPTATAAGKSVQCNATSPGVLSCIITAVNTTTIAAGVVANVSATVNKATTITMQGLVVTSAAGTTLTGLASPSTVALTLPTVAQAVSCIVPPYDVAVVPPVYSIEPGESVSCTLTLSQAAGAGGFTAPVSDAPTGQVTVPATVVVPQGQLTATFQIVGQ